MVSKEKYNKYQIRIIFNINVKTIKIFLPHFFSLNKAIVDIINNNINKHVVAKNWIMKKAPIGIYNIKNKIIPPRIFVITPPIPNTHKLIGLFIIFTSLFPPRWWCIWPINRWRIICRRSVWFICRCWLIRRRRVWFICRRCIWFVNRRRIIRW